MKKIRLLLIEDNRLLREGFVAMLTTQADINIIADSGKNGISAAGIRRLKPNVVLLELGLRSLNSLYAVEMVKKASRSTKIIVIDFAPAQGDMMKFVKAGVEGFILKNATLTECLATIRAVANGSKVLPPVLDDSLLSQIVEYAVKGGKTKLKEALRMTRREKEVVELIDTGFSTRDIGRKLHISTHAIKSHLHNIMEKLALHTRLEMTGVTEGDEQRRAIRKRKPAIAD